MLREIITSTVAPHHGLRESFRAGRGRDVYRIRPGRPARSGRFGLSEDHCGRDVLAAMRAWYRGL